MFRRSRTKRRKPDPARIAATTVAVALHAALAMLVFRPVAPEPSATKVDMQVVQVVPAAPRRPRAAPPMRPAPAPPPPRRAASPQPAPEPTTTVTEPLPPANGSASPAHDLVAPPGIVIYGDRAAVSVVLPDLPPRELREYRAGFDPASVDGLSGPAAGGWATFDVLVDGSGTPTAVVIVQQACDDRALQAALSVISQWRFIPGMREGLPVAAWLRVPLQF